MRRIIGTVALVAALAAGVPGPRARDAAAQQQPPVPPNILVILTDDQRRDGTLGVMRSLRREFIKQGTEFRQTYATTPLCCPSRASIWTGLYTHNHGVRSNDGTQFANLPQELTVQSYLQRIGYNTAYFGKYFNKWPLGDAPPYFDRWAINSFGSSYRVSEYNVDGTIETVERYDTTFITRKLLDFINTAEGDDERPWFAVLAPKAPHGPSIPAPRYEGAPVGTWDGNPAVFEEDRTDKHPDVQVREEPFERAQRKRNRQLRTLLSVDDAIERTFDLMRDLKEARKTLAIYISDNGLLWGEHRILAKSQPFTPAIQIPLVIRGPGFARDAVDDRLVANIDIAPTILDVIGIEPDEAMNGISLLSEETRERLLIEYFRSADFEHTGKWASTLTPTYQYIEYYEDPDPQNTLPTFREYYDMVADPWQLENLFGDLDVTNDPTDPLGLHEQLREDRTCSGDACP